MRKAVLYGLALVCVCLLFALSGPSAQRTINGDSGSGAGTSPVAVSVANFPQVQPVQVDKTVTVTGSVAVTNFPTVQHVVGTLNVGNLPTDESGALRVSASSAAGPIHFLGLTTATFINEDQPLLFSRACSAAIPNSRICDQHELIYSIPAPEFTGVVHIVYQQDSGGTDKVFANCIDANGHLFNCSLETPPFPVACCGY